MKQPSLTFAIFFIFTTLFFISHVTGDAHPFLSDSFTDDFPSADVSSGDMDSPFTGEATSGTISDPCNSHVCQHQWNMNVHSMGNPANSARDYSLTSSQAVSDEKKCPALLAYNHCMKTLSKSCRGNLEYHTVVTAVRKLMEKSNCSGSHHKSRQGMRSSFPLRSESERRQDEEERRRANEQRRIDRCINEVLNFTFDHQNYIKNQEMRKQRKVNRGHSRPLVKRDERTIDGYLQESLARPPRSPSRGGKRLPSKHSTGDSSELDMKNNQENLPPAVTVNNDSPPLMSDGNSLLLRDIDEDEEDDECEDDEDCGSANNDQPLDDQFANLKSLYERDEEPLLCSVFGGPHVRTFTDKYQTCLLQGARPMIDHPLFAVQVTSSRDETNRDQIPGITKVTLLVRRIMICGIESDLVYEVDMDSINSASSYSSSDDTTDGSSVRDGDSAKSLPIIFKNGDSSTKNGLVKVFARSDNEVCISLDHLAVQVCVRKFTGHKYLNIIVKFKKHMSTAQRSSMIDSMDSYTLCTSGCSYNEQVDVPKILSAVGLDVFNDSVFSSSCQGLYGYYMVACLFDVKMKGTRVDQMAVHRFAQEMDDPLVVKRSFVTMKSEYFSSTCTSLHLSTSFVFTCFASCIALLYSLPAWSAKFHLF